MIGSEAWAAPLLICPVPVQGPPGRLINEVAVCGYYMGGGRLEFSPQITSYPHRSVGRGRGSHGASVHMMSGPSQCRFPGPGRAQAATH